jgi:hypothetical protein
MKRVLLEILSHHESRVEHPVPLKIVELSAVKAKYAEQSDDEFTKLIKSLK